MLTAEAAKTRFDFEWTVEPRQPFVALELLTIEEASEALRFGLQDFLAELKYRHLKTIFT